MCLLVVCNPNSTPSKDDLSMGACKNPHGFGFAIDTGDGIALVGLYSQTNARSTLQASR